MLDPSDPPPPTRTPEERFGPVATWRGLATIDPVTGLGSLSLSAEDGTVHRFRLSVEELAALAGVCTSTVAAYAVRMKVHSVSSSGSPASAVSMPLDGVNV